MRAAAMRVPLLLLAPAALLGGGAWRGASPTPAPSAREGAAAGDTGAIGAVCVDCHADLVATYRETGMARALEPLRPGEGERLAGLAPVDEPATGYRYRFEADPARVVESWRAASGPAADLGSAPLRFAIGAGLMDRAYAAERGGLLWFAPLEVMTGADGPHAVLAPAHAQRPGVRLRHPITTECLGCHTDLPPDQGYPLNAEPRGVPERWTARGITCAACHGDVDGHVAWRAADLAGEHPDGGDPVSTSRTMGRVERLSVCARCHLQGDARLHLARGERGLSPVGADLLDHLAVWIAAGETEDIGFVSQVERLVRSRCFTETADWGARGLACESCHDPHRSSFEATERARVRAACADCHSRDREPHAAACGRVPAEGDRDCVACHMRVTPPFDLFHVKIHDHFIRTRPPAPSSFERIRSKQSLTSELERFTWPGRTSLPFAGDPGLQMMALLAANQERAALELADERADREVQRLPMYHHLRGGLLERSGRLEEARLAYERALLLDPDQVETSVNLGLVLSRLGRGAEGLEALDGVIARHPLAEGALRNRAVAHAALGGSADAIADLEAAQRILPRAENARALDRLYTVIGDAGAAERWRAEAERLQPSR